MFLNGIALGICLLSLSLLMLRANEQAHSKLAAGITISLGWLVSGVFLLETGDLMMQVYVASLPPVFFALLPLIYWYQQSLIAEQVWRFSKHATKHLLPISVALLLGLSILLMPGDDFFNLFFADAEALSLWSSINAAWFGIMLVGWLLLSSFYLARVLKRTYAYHQKLKNLFADNQDKTLHWFSLFVVWMLVTWFYSCLVLAFENALADYYINETGVSWLLLVLVWLFCLHALTRKPALVGLGLGAPEQYQNSSIDADRLARIAAKINQAVIDQKAYLDADINAAKLSKTLGVSTHYLSQTFSQSMHTTFYDYINAARIEAAKLDLIGTNKTVLDIATAVGFNTRSAFYNAFKKHTGMTPSAYREQR